MKQTRPSNGPYCASSSPTLGVVAISYNEERDLPAFLSHLLPWVHEIVLVDDGSTDRTREIALAAQGKVTFLRAPREKGEFYSDQRNKGIRVATSDWLLHMDIDERVTPEMAAEVLQAIQDGAKDAYRYRRINFFLHRRMRGGGWQDWNQVHLARRDCLRFEGMFHERCVLNTTPERTGTLAAAMIHLNDESFRERMRKSDTYLDEIVARVSSRKRPIGYCRLAGVTLWEFVRKYVIKRGFRDGVPGLIFAIHAACAVFRAHAIVWDEQNQIERSTLEADLANRWNSMPLSELASAGNQSELGRYG